MAGEREAVRSVNPKQVYGMAIGYYCKQTGSSPGEHGQC